MRFSFEIDYDLDIFDPLSILDSPAVAFYLSAKVALAWLVLRYVGYTISALLGRLLGLTRDEISVALFGEEDPSKQPSHLERSLEWVLPEARL